MEQVFDKKDYDNGIAIIGGGASGLMAAVIASSCGAAVRVFDRNAAMGAKILATGNGRCNFTNTKQSMDYYHSSDPKEAEAVLGRFDARSVCRFFHDRGVVTLNRDGWMYPKSQTATTIRDTLTRAALKNQVKLLGNKEIRSVTREEDGSYSIHLEGFSYKARAVILAAGGSASKQHGTCGDGFSFARSFGLSVKKPLPALVPLTVKRDPLFHAAGVRIQGRVSLLNQEEKRLATMEGQLQLTDYGISGIPVFGVSQKALRSLEDGISVIAELDLLPELSSGETVEQLEKIFLAGIRYDPLDTGLSSVLAGIFPEKLSHVLLKKAGNYEKMPLLALQEMEEEDFHQFIKKLSKVIHHYRLTVTGSRGFDQAQTTSGGVLLSQLDVSHMADPNHPGLFLCGELLDVDGVCGGYNLQWAFSSGYVAGLSASLYIREINAYD